MSFTYTQTTPQSVWNVNHNLDVPNPVVDVWVDDNGITTIMLPKQIRLVDTNRLEITFTIPVAGSVVIN
jgi:hypothetical protein